MGTMGDVGACVSFGTDVQQEYDNVPADVEQAVLLFVDVNGQEEAVAVAPLHIVAVLDSSASMRDVCASRHSKMESACRALLQLVQYTRDKDHFTLVLFHTDVRVLFTGVLTEHTRSTVVHIINGLKGCHHEMGGTNMHLGIQTALQLAHAGSSEMNSVVVLLGDGNANQGVFDPDALVNAVVTMLAPLHRTAKIQCIGFGADVSSSLFTQLADAGDGTYFYADAEETIVSALGAILGAARTVCATNVCVEWSITQGAAEMRRVRGGSVDTNDGGRDGVQILGDVLAGSRGGLAFDLFVQRDAGDGHAAIVHASLHGWKLDGTQFNTDPVTITITRDGTQKSPLSRALPANDHRMRIDGSDAMLRASNLGDSGQVAVGKKVLADALAALHLSPAWRANMPFSVDTDAVLRNLIDQYSSDTAYDAGGRSNRSRVAGGANARMCARTLLLACTHPHPHCCLRRQRAGIDGRVLHPIANGDHGTHGDGLHRPECGPARPTHGASTSEGHIHGAKRRHGACKNVFPDVGGSHPQDASALWCGGACRFAERHHIRHEPVSVHTCFR